MGPRRTLLLALACCLSLVGCSKKTPKAERSSAVDTLHSFFRALNRGEFPDQLETYIGDEAELATWKVRCKSRGCEMGKFKLLEIVEEGENGATIRVQYRIYGKSGTVVMGNESSDFRFERQDDHWLIVQFGRQLKGPKGEPGTEPAPVADAAPPMPDGGGDEDASPSP